MLWATDQIGCNCLLDDSEDDGPLDPWKELTEYLYSKCEHQKERLVEWWRVSMACMLSWCLTNILLPYVSIILFAITPSPTLCETILPFKGPWLPQSMHFQVVSSLGPTYTTVSRELCLRHSRLSRAHIAMGSSMPATKQQLMWQWSGTFGGLIDVEDSVDLI